MTYFLKKKHATKDDITAMLGDVSVHKADFPGLLYYRPGELPGLVVVSRHRYDFLSRELARQVLEGFLLIVEL